MPDTKTIKPHICVVKIDETADWESGGLLDTLDGECKMFGVYIYDANRHVHCCELTPSYELHFLETQPSNPPENEWDYDKFMDEINSADAGGEDVRYMHVSSVDRMPEVPENGALQAGRFVLSSQEPWGETSDEAIEEALEWARCNSV